MMGSLILEFNFKELLALFGLVQAVYILVYMAFRAGRISRAALPVLFFLVLGLAFLFDAAEGRWQTLLSCYQDMKWFFWALCAPLSVLLVLQIARITQMPSPRYWCLLLMVPAGYMLSRMLGNLYGDHESWLQVAGIFSGGISLLFIWLRRDWLEGMLRRKNGVERYWVIISLVVLNLGILIVSFLSLNGLVLSADADAIRIIIGISFAYVATTSLFRIYPQAVSVEPVNRSKNDTYLSDSDIEIALAVETLLFRDKVYQEPSYGRSDMAREVNLTESNLSRIVNSYFQKSVPQLLNELRVEEAKTLLVQTKADVTTISGEAGFNSIATFNRVFKEIEGVSPSDYRKNKG